MGETLQREGVFLSGSGGSLVRLLGSQPFLVTEEQCGLSRAKCMHAQLSPAFGGSLLPAVLDVGLPVGQDGPAQATAPGALHFAPQTGQVQRPWKPSKILCHLDGCSSTFSSEAQSPLRGSVSGSLPQLEGTPESSLSLYSYSPVLSPKM